MHRWETILTIRGSRFRGRLVRVLLCKGCGMLWNSSTRKPVPICWHRYEPPHWAQWWADFQRLAAYQRQERLVVQAAHQQHDQQQQHPAAGPQRPFGQHWASR